MRRFVQVVIVVNIAIALVIALPGYLFHVGPNGSVSATEPILARELAALYVGYIAILLVILRRFRREPAWLLVPALLIFPQWLATLYEVSVGTAGEIPPAIIRPLLVACYVASYLVLTKRAAGAAQASGSTMSPTER